MLKTFAISNFRSLDSVALEHLGRVTLVSGKNGSGKTTLLEALWLFNEPDAPELVARLHALRGLSPAGLQSRFQDLFYGFNKQTRIKMTACGDWNDAPRELEISMQPRRGVSKVDLENMERSPSDQETSVRASSYDLVFRYRDEAANVYASRAWFENRLPSENGLEAGNQSLLQERQWVEGRAVSVFLPAIRRDTPQAIASRFGAWQLEGREHEILTLLRLLAPRLDRLTSISLKGQPAVYEGQPAVHAYFEGSAHPIPVQLLGEGFNRMLALSLSMKAAKGGMLLIDEIENGLHHSVQKDVFVAIDDMAQKYDVQLCAATHSAECVLAAHQALRERDNGAFAFYRLDAKDGATRSFYFANEMMDTARDFKMEIR